jgi:hypothetical protein
MVSKNVITILSVVTCLFTLTSVGLTAYHSVGHVYYKNKDTDLVIKTSSSNTEDCPPAVKVKVETDHELQIISCPFKPATKAIAFISLILCQFLLILLCCKLKNKVSSMVIIIFAIIDFPLLFVGGILMIVDMINGKKEVPDLEGYSYQPIEFIIDILFLFFGMICGGIATFFAYTSKPPANHSNFRGGSQATQHGNASMSVTKPHWTEGESQSQSTDYIKPYPQGNISTYQAYQGAYGSQNTSTAYLHSNNPNTSTSSPNARGSQVYQPQNDQYLESSQNYDNPGNRRNISYKDNPQTRQRQPSNANNFNYGGNQQANNTYENSGNTPQRNMNRNMNNNLAYETNNNANANQNNYNGNQNNNSMAGLQSRGNRNNYPGGSNQSQIYSTNTNNEAAAYERSPERNPERSPDRNYANGGGNSRPNKFNSAVNRIGAMRGGVNASESGSSNKGYLNYGNETNNNQGNMSNYNENSLDYNASSSPNNRARARSNNQSNYGEQQSQGEGNYQRANQRNTHISQMNGNNIPYNNNNGGMSRPPQNYGGY